MSVDGAGASALVGRGGETIDALQYLLAQIASRAEGAGAADALPVVEARYRYHVGFRSKDRPGGLEAFAAAYAMDLVHTGGNCDFDAWDPNTDNFGIIADGQDASGYGVKLENQARYQGSIYATNAVLMENSTQYDGPMVAGTFKLENNIVAHEFPQLCEAETEAIGAVLGTHVQRLATIAHGDGVCTTCIPQTPKKEKA